MIQNLSSAYAITLCRSFLGGMIVLLFVVAANNDPPIVTNNGGCLAPVGQFSGSQNGDSLGSQVAIVKQNNGPSFSSTTWLAIGSPGYNDHHGRVQVYSNNNNQDDTNSTEEPGWEQQGGDLIGEETHSRLFGSALALTADARRIILAVGAREDDTNGIYSGQVQVYQLVLVSDTDNGAENSMRSSEWQAYGNAMLGQQGEYFGGSVALSADGSVLAVGSWGGASRKGQVNVFEYNNDVWIPRGNPLEGEKAGNFFGLSISLSKNGSILAVGAPWTETKGGGLNSGKVYVFSYTSNNGGEWQPMGSNLDGTDPGNYFGYSVSLSYNGQCLAVGGPVLNTIAASRRGHVRVFQFVDKDWSRLGQTLEGHDKFVNPNDKFGYSVSFSEDLSLVLAVGDPQAGPNQKGRLYLFQLDQTNIQWQLLTTDDALVMGVNNEDGLGAAVAVSSDGTTIVVGGEATASAPGLVRVFDLDDTCRLESDGHILRPPDSSSYSIGPIAWQQAAVLLFVHAVALILAA